jgi:hypothetical protein
MRTKDNRAPEFALSMGEVLGRRLVVSWSEREPWSLAYDVLAGTARVGSLRLDDPSTIARLASAEGEWCVTKRQRLGWELAIESAEGRHAGWYSGRRCLSGGTISLTDGTQVDLRRSITAAWRLEETDTGSRIADMRISGPPLAQKIVLTVNQLPPRITQGSVVILASCAVRILYRMITAPIGVASP